MRLETNGEYNPCQLNETINLSPDEKVLSKSIMFNLRGETPKDVYRAYQELKELIEHGEKAEPEKKVKSNPMKKEKQAKKDNPGVCEKCGAPLIEKQGISSKNGRPYHFYSCSAWPICDFSKPFLTEKEKNVPCDEDLLMIDA